MIKINNVKNEHQEQLFKQYGSILGFHGSSPENFISILRYGFERKYIKFGSGLFGDGIYFSSDPLVAKNFVRYYTLPENLIDKLGRTFVKNIFGDKVGFCIVCEVAKHPEEVQYASNDAGAYIGFSRQGEIAKHYITASSNHFVKQRYLFIYSQFNSNNRNFLLLMICVYVFILLVIIAIKSKSIQRFIARRT